MSNALVCPKCDSEMRSYERNGVVVDQCTGCGGLFLDRGELETLAKAENAFYAAEQPQTQPSPAAPERPQQKHDDGRGYKKKKKSKKSFLEDLLEFGG